MKTTHWYDRTLNVGLALGLMLAGQVSNFLISILIGIQSAQSGQMNTNINFADLKPFPIWVTILLALVDIAVVVLVLWLAKRWKLIKKDDFSWRTLILGLVIGYALIFGIQQIGDWLLSLQGKENASNQIALESMSKLLPFAYMFLSTALLAPVLEELVFRGLLQMGTFGNTWWGYLLTSLLFGLAHTPDSFGALFVYTTMGLVLGWFTYRYKRLEYSIALHMFNNVIGVILMYL